MNAPLRDRLIAADILRAGVARIFEAAGLPAADAAIRRRRLAEGIPLAGEVCGVLLAAARRVGLGESDVFPPAGN